MIPEMNNIFQGIIHEIIPYISSKERIAFFNLGEINNCSKNNLTEAIKLLKECIAVYNKEYYHSYCPYINKAVYPTGSNDNFHAGFCLGVLLKLPVQLCLVLASASYAYYAKTKKKPTVKELIDFLHHWKR